MNPDDISNVDLAEAVDTAVFGGELDAIGQHVKRKQAVADPARYAMLYLLAEGEDKQRSELLEATDGGEERLDGVLEPLIDAGLVVKVPGPGDGELTEYRVTGLGKDELVGPASLSKD